MTIRRRYHRIQRHDRGGVLGIHGQARDSKTSHERTARSVAPPALAMSFSVKLQTSCQFSE